jgi:dolichol-phosphate mannosyltransferase
VTQLKKNSISIVVPTYREADNLLALVSRVCKAMSHVGRPYEIIVVDDDSRDGTERVVKELSDSGYPIRMITRLGLRDLSTAVLRGFSEASGDTLVCMDADLSHPPETISIMLQRLQEPGVELVLGSRYVSGGRTDQEWGPFRWINSKIASAIARPFTSIKDPMSGFFAIPREIYTRAAFLNPIGYKIALELIVKCECSVIREIPIRFSQRRAGKSKLSLIEQLKFLRHVSRLVGFKVSGFFHASPRARLEKQAEPKHSS